MVICWTVMMGIVGGILIDIENQLAIVEVQKETAIMEAKQEVKLEVVIDWTPERIEKEVMKVFPDAPIMLKVMKCEGGYDIDAHNPINNSHDRGLFQISTKYHGARVKALGLDMNNPIDNIHYAKILYDEQGLTPWKWSKPCWNK